jgi:polar amino acid transport system substrate-binding protein
MRQAALAVLLAALAAASATAAPAAPVAASASCAKTSLSLVKPGVLTVGTDNPAYPPWYGGSPGHGWKVSDPTSGKGYESAVAYAVAKQLGFAPSEVQWTYVPFNRSFSPGKKSFDFDINQISYSPARAKVVTFSDSYYDVNQALVVLDGSKISKVHSVAGLKPFKLGAQLGTTSYQFIVDRIKPSSAPAVFPQNAGAVQALKNRQIDGLVVDLPTAFYVRDAQVPHSMILGQFSTASGGEHFGMVFAKGDPLAACVDGALAKLKANGTLARIQQQWLAKANGAPILK